MVAPEGVILSIELEPLSTTYNKPVESHAIPFGLFNPVLAIVVTTPAGVIIQTRLFPASVTYRLLFVPIHIPMGFLNLAALPVPVAFPDVPGNPANVCTVSGYVITLIQ